MTKEKFLRYLLPILVILLIFPLFQGTEKKEKISQDESLPCLLRLRGWSSPSMRYSAGYNYELLRLFTRDADSADIRICGAKDTIPPEILGGIVVLPASDSLPSGWYRSISLADSTVWASTDSSLVRRASLWLARFTLSQDGIDLAERFTPGYEPYRRALSGRSYPCASPYDDLLKKYAAEIGWDWRMLAALVWKESAFRIEALSPKGAEGLMQMLPSTAGKYDGDDMLDPESNLKAACAYLKKLQGMFEGETGSQLERMKFTLAAYNAGEGRVRDMISYAKSKGLPHDTWLDLEAVLPEMRKPSILEESSVKNGMFKGYETMEYIREMQSLYWAFCVIAPGPSLQDRFRQQRDSSATEEALSPDTLRH